MYMIYGLLTLLTALCISAIAIYYSVAGLVAIFAAAALPIIIMGTALEIGKLVTAVWLHKYWSKATWWLRTYLSTAVVVLMFITSMGIFGFLSKAHIEQTSAGDENVAQVERIENEITRYEDIITRAENKIKKLETSNTGSDANVQSQIDAEQDRIDKAYDRVQPAIDEQQKIIDSQADLYKAELAKIDEELKTLQTYVDNGETKKAQQMIGASADGIFGKKTAEKIGDWKEIRQQERAELISKIEQASNNPQAQAAREEIKRLRTTVEKQIAQSNELIDRLRKQLGDTSKIADIDSQVDEQNLRIKDANNQIDVLTEEKYAIQSEYRKLEAEVGPIKYIAEFVYGENATQNMLEEAVRWVIIIIIFVFDPLAVLLLIASQYTFEWNRRFGPGGDDNGSPKLDPKPKPPFTDEEYDEAWKANIDRDHEQALKDNEEFDRKKYENARAQKIADNIPPEIETAPVRLADEEQQDVPENEKTTHEMLMEGFEEEKQDNEDLEKWNDWVEAANKAAKEEDPNSDEDDDFDDEGDDFEDEDDDFEEEAKAKATGEQFGKELQNKIDLADEDEDLFDGVDSEEKEAMKLWKMEDPTNNKIKETRQQHEQGKIKQLPWAKYLKAQADYKVFPELEEEISKKKESLSWIEKDGAEQVKKTIEKEV
tara:strand:- start:10683 stop:12653 length:1971 start_codon:yes stop_codon:yes gene_type:complete